METTAEELRQLRQRVDEAEEVCRAIRRGEVDGVVVDVSEDAKRVLLMSGAYARYRQVVEDMDQGAVTVTESGEILFANHAFAKMTGKGVLDLFRTPLQSYIRDEHEAQIRGLLKGRPGTRDVEVTLGDPKRTPVRMSLVSSSDDFITILVTDLSAHLDDDAKATLEAIRQGLVDAFVVGGDKVVTLDSQGPFRALVEHMHEGAVTVAAGDEIVYANDQFGTMIAAPVAHAMGKPLRNFVVDADRPALQRLLASSEAGQAEVRLQRPRGETLATLVTMTRLDGHKLLLFSDVTLRKRHAASDELTRKFLGMLAHEFRNILAPIRSSTDYLQQVTQDPDARKAIDTIARQTDRLVALVEDLRRVNPKE